MGGRAFRTPSVYEEFYTDGGVTTRKGTDPTRKNSLTPNGAKLGPESVWSGEVELSHRFKEDWVALAAGHGSYVQGLINTLPVPGSTCFQGATCVAYVNSPFPALAIGGDVELRREWRQGWMISAYYSYENAKYIDYTNLIDARLVNAPEHLAAFKGVVPLLPDLVSIAARVTLEAPRRITGSTDPTQQSPNTTVNTPTAVVADLTASGNIKRFGIGYVFGVYNVTDSHYVYPVTSTYLSSVMRQPGRTFLGDITVTYP
jgi:hypothetical protein